MNVLQVVGDFQNPSHRPGKGNQMRSMLTCWTSPKPEDSFTTCIYRMYYTWLGTLKCASASFFFVLELTLYPMILTSLSRTTIKLLQVDCRMSSAAHSSQRIDRHVSKFLPRNVFLRLFRWESTCQSPHKNRRLAEEISPYHSGYLSQHSIECFAYCPRDYRHSGTKKASAVFYPNVHPHSIFHPCGLAPSTEAWCQ